MAEQFFLTTQPGWAFATLAELRSRGVRSHVPFCHRDSSLVVPFSATLVNPALLTPEDVCGLVLAAGGTSRSDATEQMRRLLDPDLLQQQVLRWLASGQRWQVGPAAGPRRPRHFSVETEVWGDTALRRHALADLIRQAVRRALPRWRELPSGGARLVCKADPSAAFLGLQLYSNLTYTPRPAGQGLSLDDSARHGALREHLACGLLALARVQVDDAVLDPFMGTGTILRAARQRLGVRTCIGAEIDPVAFRLARRAVDAPEARLLHSSFEQLDLAALPRSVKLVSNLPFGVQFAPVPTSRLLAFLVALRPRLAALALLMSRAQAREVTHALPAQAKHVLVLGQPAAIVYTSQLRQGVGG